MRISVPEDEDVKFGNISSKKDKNARVQRQLASLASPLAR
jgi:hypothetical protein